MTIISKNAEVIAEVKCRLGVTWSQQRPPET